MTCKIHKKLRPTNTNLISQHVIYYADDNYDRKYEAQLETYQTRKAAGAANQYITMLTNTKVYLQLQILDQVLHENTLYSSRIDDSNICFQMNANKR